MAIGLIVWLISPWLPPTEKHVSSHQYQYWGMQVDVTTVTVNDWKFGIFLAACIICVVVYLLLNAKSRSKR